MSVEIQTFGSGAILYDSSRVAKPDDKLFNADFWSAQRKVSARQGGRGGVLFIRDGERNWVLRHYRRGGRIASLLGDRYVWRGAERTRAFREWRLLHTLHAQNLPVPAPVATRYVRNGIWYRADLITEALPAARTLAESITGVRLNAEAWRNIGAVIAKFHHAGVHHADLNAHNILLGEGAAVFVLDFDRGKLRERGAWEENVLARLERSLQKLRRMRANVQFEARDWQSLLDGYRQFRV